jgi:hypothetical protein
MPRQRTMASSVSRAAKPGPCAIIVLRQGFTSAPGAQLGTKVHDPIRKL